MEFNFERNIPDVYVIGIGWCESKIAIGLLFWTLEIGLKKRTR